MSSRWDARAHPPRGRGLSCEEHDRPWLSNQVDEREDHDPDNVNEVPVQCREVNVQRICRPESALIVDREKTQQPEHASSNVRAVETCRREECRAKEVRAD